MWFSVFYVSSYLYIYIEVTMYAKFSGEHRQLLSFPNALFIISCIERETIIIHSILSLNVPFLLHTYKKRQEIINFILAMFTARAQ